MLGLPLELITMLGSGLLSGVMTMWSMKLKAARNSHDLMIRGMTAKGKLVDQARRYDNPGFQFTRRMIAISAVLAIVVWPKVAPVLWPGIAVTVGWTEFNPGFWFFTDGVEAVRWISAQGLVITPLDTHLMSAIIGLYFGSSVVRNA